MKNNTLPSVNGMLIGTKISVSAGRFVDESYCLSGILKGSMSNNGGPGDIFLFKIDGYFRRVGSGRGNLKNSPM